MQPQPHFRIIHAAPLLRCPQNELIHNEPAIKGTDYGASGGGYVHVADADRGEQVWRLDIQHRLCGRDNGQTGNGDTILESREGDSREAEEDYDGLPVVAGDVVAVVGLGANEPMTVPVRVHRDAVIDGDEAATLSLVGLCALELGLGCRFDLGVEFDIVPERGVLQFNRVLIADGNALDKGDVSGLFEEERHKDQDCTGEDGCPPVYPSPSLRHSDISGGNGSE